MSAVPTLVSHPLVVGINIEGRTQQDGAFHGEQVTLRTERRQNGWLAPVTEGMKKILLYTGGTGSLADIRRMLAVAVDQSDGEADLSVLVISGAAVRDGFRLGPGIYRVHLPPWQEERDRGELIRHAVEEFGPDAIVVDTMPLGIANELERTLSYVREHLPGTSLVLVLRETAACAATIGQAGCTTDANVDRIYHRVLTMQ